MNVKFYFSLLAFSLSSEFCIYHSLVLANEKASLAVLV